MVEAQKFDEKYPYFSRDNGAQILDMIYHSEEEVFISIDFAADSLFCQWAYVIDLDKNTFEI